MYGSSLAQPQLSRLTHGGHATRDPNGAGHGLRTERSTVVVCVAWLSWSRPAGGCSLEGVTVTAGEAKPGGVSGAQIPPIPRLGISLAGTWAKKPGPVSELWRCVLALIGPREGDSR